MKKIFAILFTLTITAGHCFASGDGEGEEPRRKKVGVVLSGGGAKGVAHIGALKVIEEAGIPIDYIAGTSMGAIMGGLYSIGYTTNELDSMCRTQNWTTLLSDYVARDNKLLSEKEAGDKYLIQLGMSLNHGFTLPSGMMSGQNVLNLLNEMTIGYHDNDICFDSLPIPYACVTYDMLAGKQHVFREGNLPLAIRASMSIPGVFEPVVMDSMVLVDGGMYNNFPVDIVREMGAEIVIGVDVSGGHQDVEGLGTMGGLIDQLITIMGRDMYRQNCENVDLHIRPAIKPYTSASFSPEAVDSLLIRGERAARENWDGLIALKKDIAMTEACVHPQNARPHMNEKDSLRIGTIRFEGLTRNEEVLIRPSLRIDENSSITKGYLNQEIGRLRGSGAFSYVTYTLETKPPHELVIMVNEKQEASVNLGFRFDSQDMASILLNTTLNFRGLQGPKVGLTIRLNNNPYIRLDFNSKRWIVGRLGASYMYKQNNYRLYSRGQRQSSVAFGQHRLDAYYLVANPRKFTVNAGLRYEYFNYDPFLFSQARYESGSELLAVEPEGFLNYYVTTTLETRDDLYYPKRGVGFYTVMTLHTDNGYGYDGAAPFGSIYYNCAGTISLTDRITLTPSIAGRTVLGGSIAYSYLNYMGGDMAGRYMSQQLPFVGISQMETFSRSLLTVGLEYRHRMFLRHYLSFTVGYAMHNNNFFEMFSKRNDIWGYGLKYSYNSILGPISVLIESSTHDKSLGVHFSLGKTF